MKELSILVVDDEVAFLESVAYSLRSQGYTDVTVLADPTQALELLAQKSFALALLDITMPGVDGIELLAQIKQHSPGTECMMLTAHESVPLVVKAIRLGAYDYLLKPIEPERFHHAMERALEHRHLLEVLRLQEMHKKQDLLEQPEAFSQILTCEASMLQLLREAELHARSEIPVLITGETGTGKELLAQSIHRASRRADGPFVAINMLSLSSGLFESSLFGHAKGAFTGATESQPGYLGQAQGGTLFLDEIGDLPLDMQGKLLRVLQEREYTPVGKSRPRQADVRFIAATHQDLEALVKQGSFRNDLFYRLRFAHLQLPPLRERKDDIRLLAHTFTHSHQETSSRLSDQAVVSLLRHDWPGNVRELKGLLEAASNLSAGGTIEPMHLRLPESQTRPGQESSVSGRGDTERLNFSDELEPLAEVERRHIINVYQQLAYNKTHTAKALGISLPTLHRKLKAYQVK